MREFRLINAKGEVWNCNSLSGANAGYLNKPEGLGCGYKDKMIVFNSTFTILKRELEQPEVKGTLVFESYETYLKFSKFKACTPLVLEYKAAETFNMDCTVTKLDKGEIEEGGWLQCKIQLSGLSPFYEKAVRKNDSSAAGKVYTYTYPYVYSDSDTGTLEFIVDSEMSCGIKLYFMGPCTNPVWSHYVNDVFKASGKVNCTIESGNRLVIDTTQVPYRIQEEDSAGNVIADRYDDSDFTTKRFILLENGKNIVTATHNGESDLNVIGEGHIYYDTV